MRPTKVFAILAIAGVMFVFSLGVLTSWPVNAQGHDPRYSRNLPFQRDLWQFSANGENTYAEETNQGGHLFVVMPDASGRLPVLETIHALNSPDQKFSSLVREINGVWQLWILGDSPGGPWKEGHFHSASLGVVLQPGRYVIKAPRESYELLLSGYWAPR